jgi:hypothetical protein
MFRRRVRFALEVLRSERENDVLRELIRSLGSAD